MPDQDKDNKVGVLTKGRNSHPGRAGSVYRLQSTRKEKKTETIISPAHEMKQRPKQPEHYGNELLLITDIRIQSKTCHLSLTFKSIVEGLECVQV